MDFAVFQQFADDKRANVGLFRLNRPDPAATPEEIRQAESKLGVKLPKKYKEFVSRYGGGEFGSSVVYSLHEDSRWFIIAKALQAAYLPGGFVPFSESFTGDFYGFRDKGGQLAERVWFWDHETEEILDSGFPDILEYLVEETT